MGKIHGMTEVKGVSLLERYLDAADEIAAHVKRVKEEMRDGLYELRSEFPVFRRFDVSTKNNGRFIVILRIKSRSDFSCSPKLPELSGLHSILKIFSQSSKQAAEMNTAVCIRTLSPIYRNFYSFSTVICCIPRIGDTVVNSFRVKVCRTNKARANLRKWSLSPVYACLAWDMLPVNGPHQLSQGRTFLSPCGCFQN